LALIMKVVPVVCRQQRELLSVLAETPADTWLLTGSRIALAKRRSIERREKRVLEEFVSLAGRTVKHEFVVEEEFAWVVV
jgi:16S rRNA (guanine(1405)-N(7))-methyltransferase